MDMPASEAGTNILSATHSAYTQKFNVNTMNEDEARRFSYITSNLKGLNVSGLAGGTMDK